MYTLYALEALRASKKATSFSVGTVNGTPTHVSPPLQYACNMQERNMLLAKQEPSPAVPISAQDDLVLKLWRALASVAMNY